MTNRCSVDFRPDEDRLLMAEIITMVRRVKDIVDRYNFSPSPFVFRMPAALWEGVVKEAACYYPNGFTVPVAEIERRHAELKRKRVLVIDAVEYPVEFDDELEDIIYFEYQEEKQGNEHRNEDEHDRCNNCFD